MSPPNRIRVLVVDDSAFARKVLREALSANRQLEVVGIARDGLEALEKIAELKPDVVTLDLMMPNLDGLGVLHALAPGDGPRVVVVSTSDADSEVAIQALQNGAFDLVHKPTALATNRLYELSGELVIKVLAAGGSRNRVYNQPPVPVAPRVEPGSVRLVVIGTSTGGPQALTRLLAALPPDLPCAFAVALHIPAGYTEALSRRLDDSCAVTVVEARDGAPLPAGTVAIARGGLHLRVHENSPGNLTTHISAEPARAMYCPSVNVLFESAAALGPAALGVVLTGMGDDGMEGARLIQSAGGRTLTESEESAVVYGMPRAVAEAGLSIGEASIDRMADLIVHSL